MSLANLYQSMTTAAKAQSREEILALCEQRGIQCSREYLSQVLQGLRVHPCGMDLARLIATYFRGIVGLNVSAEDVISNVQEDSL